MAEALVDMEDARVLSEIRAGDVDAYARLVTKYQGRVSGIVAGHAPRERVGELTHEVFVRAYRSLAGYRGDSPLGHWLAKVAVRTCHDFWRAEYRRRERPESELSDECRAFVEEAAALESSEAAEETASRREAKELLAWAMDRLSPTDRMVVTLTHLEERPVAEAAEMLGISVPNVKVRAFRARKKLRGLLGGVLGT
ncbi:RNA polymerase, sigma-24 subunit, ECF subfamily [Solidesulfovibrio fructosivorans JJ]]|uniref:RNA polymerase, sigma-24 subunit, ECF subfamily n=1 Tax=Solidesulfovibrio fructosivorans JJ] TaxID=596151 RepID=E1JSJ0_SOLFR|nr:RNA polymerase sigma factor [Solidesulfovibrio fructosivorans]EFL52675.1 RNA polymerase, sigma-24 subunit, ECF subfamily [Solidesulfovibrio fructosivorans JJ]]